MINMRVTSLYHSGFHDQYTLTLYSRAVLEHDYLQEYMKEFAEVILIDFFDEDDRLILSVYRDSDGNVHIV